MSSSKSERERERERDRTPVCGETFLVSRKGGSKFRDFDESAVAVALH